MSVEQPATTQDATDDMAVRRLLHAYADVVTRRAWTELHGLLLPDAPVVVDTRTREPVQLVGPTEVGDFIASAIERFDFFEFVILNARVDLRADGDPDRATTRLYMCELRQDATTGRASTAYGLYRDEHVRRDGRWWIARRRYHSLARTSTDGDRDLDVFPYPDGRDAATR